MSRAGRLSPKDGLIRGLLTGETIPHGEDFRRMYAMIDDLVNYILGNDELQRMYDSTHTFSSGFTINIGKMVAKLLVYCRGNETFQEEMRKAVADCQEIPEGRTAHTFASDIASLYVRLLEGEDLIFYFAFLAIICEMCSRFTHNEECVTSIKSVAKAALYVYWEKTLRFDELELYARNNLNNTEETFAKHFSNIVDFLYSKDFEE